MFVGCLLSLKFVEQDQRDSCVVSSREVKQHLLGERFVKTPDPERTRSFFSQQQYEMLRPRTEVREAFLLNRKLRCQKILDNDQFSIHNYIQAGSSARLKSRHPAIKTAKTLHNENLNVEQSWGLMQDRVMTTEVSGHINMSSKPVGFDLPCRIWKTANRIRT
ncbi:hypothetical protein Trydic_g22608 [Trypoxylus dichotomus]